MNKVPSVVLAVDTTGEVLSIALRARGKTYSVRRRARRPHDETLLPAVESVMARAKIRWADLDAVAAAAGPGRFTGIRIGLAFAAVVGFERNIPALALSRLEAAADACRSEKILAALPGWKEEVYHQCFRRKGNVLSSVGIASWTAPLDWPAARAAAEAQGLTVSIDTVDATHLLTTAERRLMAGEIPPFEPFYLKPAGYEKPRH